MGGGVCGWGWVNEMAKVSGRGMTRGRGFGVDWGVR